MRPSLKMQKVLTQLAESHDFDLSTPGSRLKLTMPSFEPLIIQRTDTHQIAVAHYFISNGDFVPDPLVTFFIATPGWIPTSIVQSIGGSRSYAQLNEACDQIVSLDIQRQKGLADFTETWAENLSSQGWLSHSRKAEERVSTSGAQLATGDEMQNNSEPLFSLGQVVMTPGAEDALDNAGQTPHEFLFQHVRGDWGQLEEEDEQRNNEAITDGTRIVSAYLTNLQVKIWVVTEWDRSVTTLQLPSEY